MSYKSYYDASTYVLIAFSACITPTHETTTTCEYVLADS